jgi:hypothetical protein
MENGERAMIDPAPRSGALRAGRRSVKLSIARSISRCLKMTDVPFRSAFSLAQLIRDREIGCAELLELYLKRVERFNPKLNAIIATDLPAARRRAAEADAALAKDEVWGPLHGVPMTV